MASGIQASVHRGALVGACCLETQSMQAPVTSLDSSCGKISALLLGELFGAGSDLFHSTMGSSGARGGSAGLSVAAARFV